MRKILILVLAMPALAGRAQVAVNYYPFQSLLSISSNPEKLLWGDFRVETNTFISNMNMEVGPMLSLKRTEMLIGYFGAGVSFNPAYIATPLLDVMNGSFLSGGVRVKPFEKNRNIHLLFELSPYINTSFRSGNLRTRLGVGYNFARKTTPTSQP